jgi:hypothetical protein
VSGAEGTGLKGQSPDGLKLSPEGALLSQTGVFSASKVVVKANSLALKLAPKLKWVLMTHRLSPLSHKDLISY